MKKIIFSVPEISCDHCTSAIEKELSTIEGVQSVSSDVTAKTTTVECSDTISIDQLIEAFDNIGFEAKAV